MRTFIAIELEKEIRNALFQIQEELESSQADIKWVKPENIHLTLKFLGEVEETKIPEIIQRLQECGGQIKPFTIRISGLGAFPGLKSARVIWVGVKEDTDELTKLAKMIEDSLVKLGFPKEGRKFSAHLTLGRLRSNKNKDKLGQKLEKIKIPELSQRINSIALFESVLHPTGAAYQKLSEIILSKI